MEAVESDSSDEEILRKGDIPLEQKWAIIAEFNLGRNVVRSRCGQGIRAELVEKYGVNCRTITEL